MKPFLKWAGGKRWLARQYVSLMPKNFNWYFEPFLGGGAVFFELLPEKAVLSDANEELINTYTVIKRYSSALQNELRVHHVNHSKEYYYHVRENVPTKKIERAARFIYLNRTCWNGLYRVNLKGKFNVPIGTKTDVIYPDDDFPSIRKALLNAELLHSDFELVIDRAERGDLLFVDPPYTVRHDLNGFVKYNEDIFSWGDQERLAACVKRARRRGVNIFQTNADHESVRALYSSGFEMRVLTRNSPISGKPSGRSAYKELLIISR